MKSRSETSTELAAGVLTGIVFVILYAPVIISAIFSVVEIDRGAIQWDTFTFSRYATLWSNSSVIESLAHTTIVALSAVFVAALLAVLLALYVQWSSAFGPRLLELVIYLPFLLPPIVTGLSLLIMSAELGIDRGLQTIVLGHAVFLLAVCFRLVSTRLAALPRSLIEASSDLGATNFQTLRYVLMPHLMSAVVTGAVLALTLSFDETLISVFLAGDTMTLPLRLWAMMRVGFTAEINALVTLVLLVSILLAMAAAIRMKPAGMAGDE